MHRKHLENFFSAQVCPEWKTLINNKISFKWVGYILVLNTDPITVYNEVNLQN